MILMRRARIWHFVAAASLWLAPVVLYAAGGEAQGNLVHVADTRNLAGFNLWIANLYNTDRVMFTVVSVGMTIALGFTLGLIMDVLVGAIGLDLGKRDARE
jgi:hypothetical protein